ASVQVLPRGHDMEAQHFRAAAGASANPLTEPRQPVGMRIFNAVEASIKVALTNTNLGIVLLFAPLAAAAHNQGGGGAGDRSGQRPSPRARVHIACRHGPGRASRQDRQGLCDDFREYLVAWP